MDNTQNTQGGFSMTKTEIIEDSIIRKGIHLDELPFLKRKGMSIIVDKEAHIGINSSMLLSDRDRYVVLGHELAHIEGCAMYSINSSLLTRKRRERKANYLFAKSIIDPIDLKRKLCDNMSLWEIADSYEVTDEFMEEVIKIYRSKELI